ncbi:hypothetical protein ACLBO3_13420, partial [Klebsiella pneumoniae]
LTMNSTIWLALALVLVLELIYWVMATVLSSLQNYFENQLNRQERDPK